MATKNTAKLAGGITQAQLDQWKKEHEEIHVITVEVSKKDKAVGYLRPLQRHEYGLALQAYNKKSPIAAAELVLNNCWLGGDERIMKEDKVYISAATAAQELVDFLPSSISKV